MGKRSNKLFSRHQLLTMWPRLLGPPHDEGVVSTV